MKRLLIKINKKLIQKYKILERGKIVNTSNNFIKSFDIT